MPLRSLAGLLRAAAFVAVALPFVSDARAQLIAHRTGMACVLTASGGIKCWNDSFGSSFGGNTPVAVPGATSGMAAVVASHHACGLTSAGAVKCWGYNASGQVGNGMLGGTIGGYTSSGIPVNEAATVPLSGPAIEIALTSSSSCALLASGAVQCWGDNSGGQLGDGTTTSSLVPVNVTGLTGPATQLVAGESFACALVSGGARCWGRGAEGQFGNGLQTITQTTPILSTGHASGVRALVAGSNHLCALTTAGAVRCNGIGSTGQLGPVPNNTYGYGLSPATVSGIPGTVDRLFASAFNTCALNTAGALACWGSNRYGELGLPTTDDFTVPTTIPLSGRVIDLALGTWNSCAVLTSGPQCWGWTRGILSGLVSNHAPVQVPDLTGSFTRVVAGLTNGCARRANGELYCWGSNASGQLNGRRRTGVQYSGEEFTAYLHPLLHSMTLGADAPGSLSIGKAHLCAVTSTGGAKCWGSNSYNALGAPANTSYSATPLDVPSLTSGVAAVAAGGDDNSFAVPFSCALTTAGGVKCWGGDFRGTLGRGAAVPGSSTPTPADVSGLSSGASRVVAGADHACAALTSGGVKCWGGNAGGKLGSGEVANPYYDPGTNTPVRVQNLPEVVTGLALGRSHTCALLADGNVKCWGGASVIGDGTSTARLSPTAVAGLPAGQTTAIAAAKDATCALSAGNVYCWGINSSGTFPPGGAYARLTPVLDFSGATSLAVGATNVCVTSTAGAPVCWGTNTSGQTGYGPTYATDVPQGIVGLGPVAQGASASSPTPASGATQSFTLPGGAPSASVGWTQGAGTLPSELTLAVQPGQAYAGATQSVQRVWHFTATGGTPGWSALVRLTYQDSDVPAGLDESTLQMHKTDDGGATWQTVAVSARDVAANWIEGTVSGFSSFVLAAPGAVLPVELAAFEAIGSGAGAVTLRWATASETANAGWGIEGRTGDGAWRELAFVRGAGTSAEAHPYAHTVTDLAPGRYRFRLRQMDLDGTTAYSPEVEATVVPDAALHLSAPAPSPARTAARGFVSVREAQPVRLTLYDALGREVARVFEGEVTPEAPAAYTLEAGTLPAGVYVLRAVGTRAAVVTRFVVAR